MTKEEMEKKRDILALEKREPYQLEYRNIVGALFCAGWDACAEEYEQEIERLQKIICKELSENDDLGSEFTYVCALKKEIKRAQDELDYLKDKIKEFIFFVGSK